MKLLNLTTRYITILLLVIIPVWGTVFYYSMLNEIYDSIDDGLDNQKGLIINKAAIDSSILTKNSFDEGDYAIIKADKASAIAHFDRYSDTLIYMQNEKSEEPVRMLKTVFRQNNNYYELKVVTSMVEEDDLIAQLLYSLLWLFGGLVISIVILNNVLLRRIWKPFHHLLSQLKKYRFDQPVNISATPSSIDEFNQLNDTIQKLLNRNMEIFNSQKRFIENASHELQTPLAIGINKLEMLAETEGLTEEQLTILSKAMDNLGKLTRLNKSLLLISKIENKQYQELDEINLNILAKKVVEDFTDLSEYYKVETVIEENGNCILQMNTDLALILLTNLIKNAIVHNIPGGKVQIIITENKFEINNTGSGEALNEETIFKRFQKQSSSSAATGIGLALTKSIVEFYNFKISYHFNGKHCLVVNFSTTG